MAALTSELSRRDILMPSRFEVPIRSLWEPGYAFAAGTSLLPMAHDLDEALGIVRPFAEPLFDGSARGTWDPASRRWQP